MQFNVMAFDPKYNWVGIKYMFTYIMDIQIWNYLRSSKVIYPCLFKVARVKRNYLSSASQEYILGTSQPKRSHLARADRNGILSTIEVGTMDALRKSNVIFDI